LARVSRIWQLSRLADAPPPVAPSATCRKRE
jgi:hypothetical protein